MLFEGPPGTGKTYLAKAMAKQAGVPFLFISATALQSMWFGMTATRIRSFFKALRKAARKEGGAIGFIEEIDAIGGSRDGLGMSPAPGNLMDGLSRTVSNSVSSGTGGMVNELLIQMQSFDQPPRLERMRGKFIAWINTYLPPERRLAAGKPAYNNILLIAATNRADSLDAALLRPGRFDRRLYFDVPTKQGRMDLIDFFMTRKAHDPEMDDPSVRDRLSHDTFGYTPVMLEHLFDESLLIALREGRKSMQLDDVYEAKLTEEIGIKQPVVYSDVDRAAVATHEAGHATVAYFLGKGKRLEVLSIIKRRDSLGLLAHGDEEEHFTRTRTEVESGIAIALGGLVAEELCLGESGTGPASDLAYATVWPPRWSARSGWPARSYQLRSDRAGRGQPDEPGRQGPGRQRRRSNGWRTSSRRSAAGSARSWRRTATSTPPFGMRSSDATSSSATRSPTSSRRRSRTAPRFALGLGLGPALSQCDDRLLDAPLPGLGRLGVLDRKHESLLLAEDNPSNTRLASVSRLSAAARSGGTSTSRGSVSSSMSTSTVSPPATPAPSRTFELTPSMKRPPIDATLLRYV